MSKDIVNRSELESFMGVGQGPNWGCSAEGKNLSIYLSIYLSVALQPFVLCPLFRFLILYTVGRTPWTGDQLDARRLPTH
jgi:hypothetical protein